MKKLITSRVLARLPGVAAVALLLVLTGMAAAQTRLSDPTRPPAGLADAADGGDGAQVVGAPVLQSILLPRAGKGRAVAVIGGQQVAVGERYGELRLIRLNEHEAVLEGPAGVERLQLTPGVEKKSRAPKPTKKSPEKTTAVPAAREVQP